jgi:conjugal transfer pilus assembly protein TraL
MEQEEVVQILRYLDEPRRIIGLTLDDCIIGGFTIFFVLFSSSKILMMLAGIGVRTGVQKMMKGNSPSYLLVLMYWHFPHAITKYFIRNLPASHKRYWVS